MLSSRRTGRGSSALEVFLGRGSSVMGGLRPETVFGTTGGLLQKIRKQGRGASTVDSGTQASAPGRTSVAISAGGRRRWLAGWRTKQGWAR